MAELTVRIKPDDIVERVVDEVAYKGKTIREWADLLTNPNTNADRIRAMSDEELAVLLEGCICPSEPCKKVVNRERQPDKKMCQSCWLDWLKQEAQND